MKPLFRLMFLVAVCLFSHAAMAQMYCDPYTWSGGHWVCPESEAYTWSSIENCETCDQEGNCEPYQTYCDLNNCLRIQGSTNRCCYNRTVCCNAHLRWPTMQESGFDQQCQW